MEERTLVYFRANFALMAMKLRDWFKLGRDEDIVSFGCHVAVAIIVVTIVGFEALPIFITWFSIPVWETLVSTWVICSWEEETCHHS